MTTRFVLAALVGGCFSFTGLVQAAPQDPAAPETPAPAPKDPNAPNLRERYLGKAKEIRETVVTQYAELAEWARANGMWLQAIYVAREIVRTHPAHAARRHIGELGSKSAREFEVAMSRHGKRGRKLFDGRRAAIDAALAKEWIGLADWADQWGNDDEKLDAYKRAFAHDPGIARVRKALGAAGYDIVYNYGLISRKFKEASKANLKRLGGKFLGPKDRDYARELKIWPDAWGFQTKHYTLLSNAGHELVLKFAQECENLYTGLRTFCGRDLPLRPARRGERLTVWLFADKISYGAVLQHMGEDPDPNPGALGFFGYNVGDAQRAYFYYSEEMYADSQFSTPFRGLVETFYHEGTHQMLKMQLAVSHKRDKSPYQNEWVAEGIAVYMETMEATLDAQGKPSFTFGYPHKEGGFEARSVYLADAALQARAGKLTPIETFTNGSYDDFQAKGPDHYAQAAALSHFLVHGAGGKYRPVFLRYVRMRYEITGSERPLWEMCGMTAQELHDAYVKWCLGLKPVEEK